MIGKKIKLSAYRKIHYHLTLMYSLQLMIKMNQTSVIHQAVLPFQIMSMINKILPLFIIYVYHCHTN